MAELPDGEARCRALAWRSERELSVLKVRLDSAFADWGRRWEVSGARVERVMNAWERDLSFAETLSWWPMSTDENGRTIAWLGAPSGQAQALAQIQVALFGESCDEFAAGVSEQSTVSNEIAREALIALSSALCHSTGLAGHGLACGDRSSPPPPSEDMRPWSGAVIVQFGWGEPFGVQMLLHLGSKALSGPPPHRPDRQPTRRATLCSVSESLSERPIRVRALLDATSLTLRDLLSLKPGDVVLTPHLLSEPFHVVTAAGGSQESTVQLCAGRLGTRSSRLALALVPGSGGSGGI
jgi:hypothetical protein